MNFIEFKKMVKKQNHLNHTEEELKKAFDDFNCYLTEVESLNECEQDSLQKIAVDEILRLFR